MCWEAVEVFEMGDWQKASYQFIFFYFYFFPKEQKCRQAEEDTNFTSLNLLY